MFDEDKVVLGIDLGTSNSAAAFLIGDTVHMVPPAEGGTNEGTVFPSYVAFDANGEFSEAGLPAKNQYQNAADLVVRHFKRLMGRPYDVVMERIRRGEGFIKEFTGRIERSPQGEVLIRVGRNTVKKYTPQEIAVFLLKKIKSDAEAFVQEKLGRSIDCARITIPAGFDEGQRGGTLWAGEQVFGKGNVELIDEPLAAAIAKGVKIGEQTIMVLDIGAGTTDVVFGYVVVLPNRPAMFVVKKESCDDELGGWDMDCAILNHLFEEDREQPPLEEVYVGADRRTRGRLMAVIESAKIQASLGEQGNIAAVIEGEVNDKQVRRVVNYTLNKSDVGHIVSPLVERCRKLFEGTLNSIADNDGCSVDEVKRSLYLLILVGGPSRMPCIRKMLKEVFSVNERIVEALNDIDSLMDRFPMECVAKGAAMGVPVVPTLIYSLGVFRFSDGYHRILKEGMPYDKTLVGYTPKPLLVEPPEEQFFLVSEKGKGDSLEYAEFPIRQYQVAVPLLGEMEVTLEWSMDGCKVACNIPGVSQIQWPELKGRSTMGALLEEFTHSVLLFAKNLRYNVIFQARSVHPELARYMEISEADLTICESINVEKASRLNRDEIERAMKDGEEFDGEEFIEEVLKGRGVPDQAIRVMKLLSGLLPEPSPVTWDKAKSILKELVAQGAQHPQVGSNCKLMQEEIDVLEGMLRGDDKIDSEALHHATQATNFARVIGDSLCDAGVMAQEEWETKNETLTRWYRGLWRLAGEI